MKPRVQFTFLSWCKTFCLVLPFVFQSSFLCCLGMPWWQAEPCLKLAGIHTSQARWQHPLDSFCRRCTTSKKKKKKSTVTLWQMFRSLHFLLISCYLLWNKHGGPRKANRPPVKNTSICISQHHKACQMAAPSRGKFPQTAVCSTQSGKRSFSGSQ